MSTNSGGHALATLVDCCPPAVEALERCARNPVPGLSSPTTRHFDEPLVPQPLSGLARSVLQKVADFSFAQRNPSRPLQRSIVAHAYSGLGRKEDALREARHTVEILPIAKDHQRGADIEIGRAAVEARVGETDAAVEHIRDLLSIPCMLSPALLRIDPRWAPLRGNARFRKLAELE
jgi:hypothetical protein